MKRLTDSVARQVDVPAAGLAGYVELYLAMFICWVRMVRFVARCSIGGVKSRVGLRSLVYSIVGSSTHRRDSGTLMDNNNFNGGNEKSNGPLVEIIGSDATKNINSTQTHILGEFLGVEA